MNFSILITKKLELEENVKNIEKESMNIKYCLLLMKDPKKYY